jgi:hypothetical protein
MTPGHWQRNTPWQRPKNWESTKAAVRRRSGGQCEATTNGHRCTNPAAHCDHITPAYLAGPETDPDGCQDLCQPHHAAKSSREGHDAARARHARRYRPTTRHPGLRRTP